MGTNISSNLNYRYDITGTSYSWRNQPLSITKGGSTTYNYSYDHMGHRVYKEEGNDIHYLRGAYGEVLAVYQNGSIDHWNILRPDGAVIGRREGSTRYYYHRDHLGSTRAVVTSGGSVTEVYDYMPFGDMMDGRITTSSAGTNEKFTGHEFDDEVNLYYMQWRRYIPRFGVFTGVDPLAGDFPEWSPYNYGLNNPIVNIDPDGEFVISFITGFIRGLGEDGATLHSAASEGWQSVKNTAQIWSSFGRGNFGQIASKFTWELPTQLVGVAGGVVNNWFGNVESITHSDGATLVSTKASGWGGITVGSIIHAEKNTTIRSGLFRHEYGHYLQSRRMGPAYLPIIGAPSIMSASGFLNWTGIYKGTHPQFITERRAQILSDRHFNKSQTQPNLPKTPEQRRQEEFRRMMLHMRR
jgi:RHS repeat-associated protein